MTVGLRRFKLTKVEQIISEKILVINLDRSSLGHKNITQLISP